MREKLVARSGLYRLPLYVPEVDEDLVQDFVLKCKREGTSASKKIMEYIRSEMPKSSLPVEEEHSSCELCQREAKDLTVARFASGRILRACQECFDEKFARGLVRVVIKKPGSES